MRTKIYNEDQATKFGKWNDSVSKLMYFETTDEILKLIHVPEIVADYGGANGNIKQFIPNAITVDIDETKTPDILDNILTHVGNYELIIIRFVLHYLNDYELIALFEHVKHYHKGQILVIQFVNEDLITKYHNSRNEFKYFRTQNQLEKLLPGAKLIYSKEYLCTNEFYKNRLNISNTKEHEEKINAYLI